jgi:hypothetical protein
MAKATLDCSKQACRQVTLLAGSSRSALDIILVGQTPAIVLYNASASERPVVVTSAPRTTFPVSTACSSGTIHFSQGYGVFWDSNGNGLMPEATANAPYPCGVALEDANKTAATLVISFDGERMAGEGSEEIFAEKNIVADTLVATAGTFGSATKGVVGDTSGLSPVGTGKIGTATHYTGTGGLFVGATSAFPKLCVIGASGYATVIADGTAGQYLMTNGSGGYGWGDP